MRAIRTILTLAIPLVVAACAARGPDPQALPRCSSSSEDIPPRPTKESLQARRDSLEALGEGPSRAPEGADDPVSKPILTNRSRAAAAIERYYPPALLQAGRGGVVRMAVYVDAEGDVQAMEVAQSSGSIELDRAAGLALQEFRFSPAVGRGCRLGIWIEIPVTFQPPAPERP